MPVLLFFWFYLFILMPLSHQKKISSMTLQQLRNSLDKREIKSVDIVNTYLGNIDKDNHQNKGINAVITLNEGAIQDAQRWDEQYAGNPGKKNYPLAGIPFLAKDNFYTSGIITTGGTVALGTSKPTKNAFVVQKLLDEGAILLGKTNMSELAASYGWLGYSSFGGQTLNPFNPLRDPSSSSSGSAAAVAANFAPFALGTDTSGSIRAPASVTGTIGLRPTLGLTSRSGIIPLSLTSDVAGVITRTVQEQAIVLDAIQGEDPADAATAQIKHPTQSFIHVFQLRIVSAYRLKMP